MDSILELQGASILRRKANDGTLPEVLAMPDVAFLWADGTGGDLVALMTEMTGAFFRGDLSGGMRRADITGGVTLSVHRSHFAAWLTREKRPLPSFWFTPDEVKAQAERVHELQQADDAVASRQKSNQNLRTSVSVTDKQISEATKLKSTRAEQAAFLGITERQLLRRLKKMQ